MCVNGFNILDPEMLSIGTGIYLACSVIDHSCDPNAVAVFDGITIHIRAVKDMPVLDWKKVYVYIIPTDITYVQLLSIFCVRKFYLDLLFLHAVFFLWHVLLETL